MGHDLILPLSAMRSVDIRKLKESGIVLPIQAHDRTLAITIWDGEPFAIVLDGPRSFTFFQIDVHSHFQGLFLPAPEIVVSMPSATRGESAQGIPGTLILENGRANVVGRRVGDRWGDPVNVPLWQEIDETCSNGKTIGFSRWSVRVGDGHERHTIWQSSEPETQD